ncbi:MAG: APC family permease [Actinomycetota bacterium]|nr:APC family permease [Actinomycetota bacterium]
MQKVLERPHSLDKQALGFWSLLFQSISHISPIGAMIANMTAIAAYAGALLPLTFVFAAFAFLFLLSVVVQFSRRVTSAGGMYGYVKAGLGDRWGCRAGWLMVLTYWMVVNFSLIFMAGVLIPQTLAYFFHLTVPSWLWIPLVALEASLIWGMAYSGIRTSLQYSLVTMAVGIIVMATAAIGIIAHSKTSSNLATFVNLMSLSGSKVSGIGVGIIFAMLSLGGASSAIYLSEETPTPKRTVTRAVIWSFGICLALFLLSAYALTVGWGPAAMSSFAKANIPGVELTRRAMGGPLADALVFFAFNASFAGTLAPANAVARIVFAMARDRVIFPASLAEVHPVHRTPSRGIITMGVVGTVTAVGVGLIFGPFTGFAVLAISATVAHFVSHILVNVSLPAYTAKSGSLSVVKHVLPAVVGSGLILFAFYLVMFPIHFPVILGPVVVATWWIVGEWRYRSTKSLRRPLSVPEVSV